MSAGLTQTDYTVMLVLLLLLSAVGLVWLGAFLQRRGEHDGRAQGGRAFKGAGPAPGGTAGGGAGSVFGGGAAGGSGGSAAGGSGSGVAEGSGSGAGTHNGVGGDSTNSATAGASAAGDARRGLWRGEGLRFGGFGAPMPHSSAEQIVRRMEQSLTDLQRQLNLDLAQLQASMKAERHDLERHVARVRQMASDHKLALTLFELFDALKALPRKTTEAQEIDRAWHGQVGIEPDDILLPEEESDPWKIYFKLSGVWYLLRVLDRKYSRIDYYEIALHDEDGRLLAELRARPDAARTRLDKEYVSSLHVGPWLSEFIALRLRMDHRLQRTLMEAASRDVESMRRSFRVLPVGKKVETASD
ncbi:MAG: hypothetical protein FJY39_08920 [Betaproteobacteria bacterium]|nr:hypothetical protein [Betaproteobacteria bacterium]